MTNAEANSKTNGKPEGEIAMNEFAKTGRLKVESSQNDESVFIGNGDNDDKTENPVGEKGRGGGIGYDGEERGARDRRGGRPALGKTVKRTHVVKVFFNDEEFRILREKAATTKRRTADFLRDAAAGKRIAAPPPSMNLAALRELNVIGSRLDEILGFIRPNNDGYDHDGDGKMTGESMSEDGNTGKQIMRAVTDCDSLLRELTDRLLGRLDD